MVPVLVGMMLHMMISAMMGVLFAWLNRGADAHLAMRAVIAALIVWAMAELVAGTIGGAAMTIMRAALRAVGMHLRLDIPRLWGTMVDPDCDSVRPVGLLIHLVGSAAVGLIYAWAFAILGARDVLWLWGVLGGLIHWFIAGLFMAAVPALHPDIPLARPGPGAFVARLGAPDVPTFIVGHVLYGVVVAALYGLLHAASGRDVIF